MPRRPRASDLKRPREVFLSHSSKDGRVATHLAGLLAAHGVPVWYSQTSLRGAQQWFDQIGQALSRCDWFLLLLTPNALTAPWVKRELLYALSDRRYEGRILPVLYRSCNYKASMWALAGYQVIDLRGSTEEGHRSLLQTWGIGYQPTN